MIKANYKTCGDAWFTAADAALDASNAAEHVVNLRDADPAARSAARAAAADAAAIAVMRVGFAKRLSARVALASQ